MSSIGYRKAFIDDAEQIDEINKQYMVENYEINWIKQVIMSKGAAVYVAIDIGDRKVIGYIMIAARRDSKNLLYGSIVSIAVRPEYRRQGIAVKLIDMGEDAIREMKLGSVGLEVRKSNKSAQKLYLKLGYARVKVIKKYYKAGTTSIGEEFTVEDGYSMKKHL